MPRNKRRSTGLIDELREFHHYEAADRLSWLETEVETLRDGLDRLNCLLDNSVERE